MSKKRYTLSVLTFTAVFFFSRAYIIAGDAPGWLKQAATVTVPTYDKTVPAVVLQDEQQVTMGSDGKLVIVENFAVRMLTREGKGYAVARADYLVSSGKVRDIVAWIIRPDGTTKSYDKKTVVDLIADPDDVYNESRFKAIDATGDVDAGYVFGYTTISEDTPLFYQDQRLFQSSRLPTLVSRYSLNLPSAWKASSITFNSPDIKPSVSGSSYSWEMRDLAPIPDEPLSPGYINIIPRIAVNYGPEDSARSANRSFSNWIDVSVWGASLHDPQVIVDDAVALKARELTANAATEIEKIRAVANYVQNLQYISIDIGVGYGNGIRPRPSALVLSRGYGDCKDKANLMRALLKVLKIEAYPIAIYSGDPTFVREQFASPGQFNHCIIAVKVSDATKAGSVIEHEKLGRLLIFDATDPYTAVGDLPDHEQGSLALIMAGDKGGLTRMPVVAADADKLERTIDVNLSAFGDITATIKEHSKGQTATSLRAQFRALPAADFRKAVEGWLTRGATGATLQDLKTKDSLNDSTFDLDASFSAGRYAQSMRGNLLVFKPVVVSRRNAAFLTANSRTTPIELRSESISENTTFNLPDGFAVDEMPPGAKLETTFGKYTANCEVKGNKLVCSRLLSMNRALVPVDKYLMVKDFFMKIRDAEQVPVVLVKK